MRIDGLFNVLNVLNVLNVIVSSSSQPQKIIAVVGVALLDHVLVAALDVKWGRGIAFTALALLAATCYIHDNYYIYCAVVILHVMQ
jgi:hypothetical protein